MIKIIVLPVFMLAGFGEDTPQQDSMRAKFGPMVESCSVESKLTFVFMFSIESEIAERVQKELSAVDSLYEAYNSTFANVAIKY